MVRMVWTTEFDLKGKPPGVFHINRGTPWGVYLKKEETHKLIGPYGIYVIFWLGSLVKVCEGFPGKGSCNCSS